MRTSDEPLLRLLRTGPQSIAQPTAGLGVTGTAVRQRLARLMKAGQVQRIAANIPRGRPSHRYSLTEQGRRSSGSNFADLALVLWKELREIPNPEIRNGLMKRIAQALGAMYSSQVTGESVAERMESVCSLFSRRNMPFFVDKRERSPVLTVAACPYPELADQDRGICAVEKMLFSELLGQNVRLTDYRLTGAPCCRFELQMPGPIKPAPATVAT